MTNTTKIFQIFYDEESKKKIDPKFLPLDNSNCNDDWFELSAIRNYLLNNKLDLDCFYGFLSPNFSKKTNFSSQFVINLVESYKYQIDVALFSIRWDQIAFFKNPFEQGECYHPGLIQASQSFLNSIYFDVDINNLITHSQTAVFSNYIIAKPKFWLKWLDLINKFYEYSKNNADVNQLTMHRDLKIPLKVFIQERLSCIILSSNTFKVATPDQSLNGPLATYFNNDNYTRRRLITCDLLKERYCKTKNPDFLNMFYLLRNEINLNDDFFFSKIAKNLINPSNNFKKFA